MRYLLSSYVCFWHSQPLDHVQSHSTSSGKAPDQVKKCNVIPQTHCLRWITGSRNCPELTAAHTTNQPAQQKNANGSFRCMPRDDSQLHYLAQPPPMAHLASPKWSNPLMLLPRPPKREPLLLLLSARYERPPLRWAKVRLLRDAAGARRCTACGLVMVVKNSAIT